MCGRFLLFTGEEYEEIASIIKEIEISHRDDISNMKLGEIFPTNTVPVITPGLDNKKMASLLKWGFPNYMQNSGVIINARGETLEEKPTFKKLIYTKRCIIPACGFYEWKKVNGKKDKYLIRPRNHNFFYMAGLYNNFLDKAGNEYKGFVIITTVANDEMSPIHNRMPVIFPSRSEAYEWIDDTVTSLPQIKSFIKPFESGLYFENQSEQLQFKI